jgi:pilus assembly protein FimV
MLRKLALLMALSPAMWLATASALGLGEINVSSELNQRFSASIPLTDVSQDEAESLLVGLAQGDAFDKAGLTRSDYLNTLTFVVKTDDGAPRIVISSKQIAREPTLNLLLDVRGPKAHIQRGFTVLLDPPNYALPRPTEASAAARDYSQAPIAAPYKAQKKSPEESAQQSLDQPSAENGSYGPVAPGETLWRVASKLRAGSVITMDQMLLALYRANPKSFENGRIGSLLKGEMLRVPTEQDIRSVSPAKASRLVRELRTGRADTSPVKQPEASQASGTSKEVVKPTTPSPTPTPMPAPAAPTPAPAAAPIAGEATPAATPAKPESTVNAASAVVVAEPASAVTTTAAPLAEVSSAPMSSEVTSASETETASLVQTQPVETVKPYIPPPIPPAPEPTPLFDEDAIKYGGGAAVIVGLLAWFVLSRKKNTKQVATPNAAAKKPFNWQFWKKDGSSESTGFAPKFKADKKASLSVPLVTATAAAGAAAAFSEEQFERDFEETQKASSGKFPSETQKLNQTLSNTASDTTQLPNFDSTRIIDAPPNADISALGTDTVDFDVTGKFEAETLKIDLDSNDPVSEADFHLAYGLYDEAALQLKQAAQKQPERTDIPTKLAEVYFRAGKATDFQEVAEGLKPRLSQAEWAKIALMGKQLSPDASLYQGLDAAALVTDMDMAFDEPAPVAAAPEPAAKPAGHSMDFELTSLDLPKLEEAPVADNSNSLEFSLDDFKFDQPSLTPEIAAPTPKSKPTAAKADEPMEFDLSEFDLGTVEPTHSELDPAQVNADEIRLDDFDLSMPEDSHTISTGDEVSTKLDLARAYVDMGDNDMARTLLNEVAQQGDAGQKTEAQTLLGRLG